MKAWPRVARLAFVRLILFCSIATGLSTAAYGAEPARLRVLAPPDASCPAAADVARELSALLPGVSISSGDGVQAATAVATLSFTDADAYRVDVDGNSRSFVDDAHHCADRARTAAVFIAMSLPAPEVAVASDRAILPPGGNNILKAAYAVYAASLVSSAAGVIMWRLGNRVSSCPPTTSCQDEQTRSYGRQLNAGYGLIGAGAALGVAVGLPLNVIGLRRNAKRRAIVVPIASSNQVGLAAIGNW
jgi:hypothetical protein